MTDLIYDTMIEEYKRFLRRNDPITEMQRAVLLLAQQQHSISIDIGSLTYGTAADVIKELYNLQ